MCSCRHCTNETLLEDFNEYGFKSFEVRMRKEYRTDKVRQAHYKKKLVSKKYYLEFESTGNL